MRAFYFCVYHFFFPSFFNVTHDIKYISKYFNSIILTSKCFLCSWSSFFNVLYYILGLITHLILIVLSFVYFKKWFFSPYSLHFNSLLVRILWKWFFSPYSLYFNFILVFTIKIWVILSITTNYKNISK